MRGPLSRVQQKHSPLIYNEDAPSDLDQLLERRRHEAKLGMSFLSAFCRKGFGIDQELAAVGDYVKAFSECQSQLQDATPPRKLELLLRMAQNFGTSAGLVGDLFFMFADQVEMHFGETSNEDLDAMLEQLLTLQQTTWNSMKIESIVLSQSKKHTAEQYVDSSGKIVELKPMREKMATDGRMIEFLRYLFEWFQEEKRHYLAKNHFIMVWFLSVLQESCQTEEFVFLSMPGLFKYPRSGVRRLRWCELGFRLQSMATLKVIDESQFSVSAYTINKFDEFGTMIMPEFGKKLNELHGLMEIQAENMDHTRNKALAYLTAFMIFLGNLLAGLITASPVVYNVENLIAKKTGFNVSLP